ncbi:uncharacterized protein LOC113280261 [Papaver somniferum]|uniref:uncharacterized protein LOC113280261 n=1 Tax=Papaver somniferum TaxID=3469 RepID=UPI000E6F90B9|nr:uncharacterized protein LOC113280261 [Papaver somniferum]
MRKHSMKVNSEKCTFGVTSGKFLGYLVTKRGIEVDPAKIQAIVEMPSPKNLKEVQKLNGSLAALGRFISRSSDKCKHFFNILKKGNKFAWTTECEEAFHKIKDYLDTIPILPKPDPDEVLALYIAATEDAVSQFWLKPTRRDVDSDVRLTRESQLVILQIGFQYNVYDETLSSYMALVHTLAAQAPNIKFRHLCRKDLRHDDALAYILSMVKDENVKSIKITRVYEPSILPQQSFATNCEDDVEEDIDDDAGEDIAGDFVEDNIVARSKEDENFNNEED